MNEKTFVDLRTGAVYCVHYHKNEDVFSFWNHSSTRIGLVDSFCVINGVLCFSCGNLITERTEYSFDVYEFLRAHPTFTVNGIEYKTFRHTRISIGLEIL